MIIERPVLFYLITTFAISFAAFGIMLIVPDAQSPEGLPGLPVWLIAIWSPSITALIMAAKRGDLGQLVSRLVKFQNLGSTWLIISIPLLVLLATYIVNANRGNWSVFTPGIFLALIGLNLVMGPLGEELGWRGFLQPFFQERMHWLPASLLIGLIWAIWHSPLWLIDSPQKAVPFWIFTINVLAYSIMLGISYNNSPHSLVPAVLLHLLFNFTGAVVEISEIMSGREWLTRTAAIYVVIAIFLIIIQLTSESRA